jgi:hypothetical protein
MSRSTDQWSRIRRPSPSIALIWLLRAAQTPLEPLLALATPGPRRPNESHTTSVGTRNETDEPNAWTKPRQDRYYGQFNKQPRSARSCEVTTIIGTRLSSVARHRTPRRFGLPDNFPYVFKTALTGRGAPPVGGWPPTARGMGVAAVEGQLAGADRATNQQPGIAGTVGGSAGRRCRPGRVSRPRRDLKPPMVSERSRREEWRPAEWCTAGPVTGVA